MTTVVFGKVLSYLRGGIGFWEGIPYALQGPAARMVAKFPVLHLCKSCRNIINLRPTWVTE